MFPSLLEQFVVGEVFIFLMVFARIGAGIIIMPGISESYISPRIRLAFALMLSLLLVPVVGDLIPEIPTSPIVLLLLLIGEILAGLFIGFFTRLLISTLHVAGTIIAYQSSLALAAFFDATQNAQSTVIGNFLTITALVFFFATDIHHLMLLALIDSYTLFDPGQFPLAGDMAGFLMRNMSEVFRLAVQLSAAHMVFALIFYLAAGVLVRLMPNMQVFFILMPAQILIGFFILLAILNAMMMFFSNYVQEMLLNLIGTF